MTGTESPIYFVGGAPRAGTTVTHALMCTPSKMNAYHSEISYVTPMVRAYMLGLENWSGHTSTFFAEREHFRLHMQGLIGQTFSHISRALGEPEILCLKDPLLTPYFPRLHTLLGARARFVTVIRNPYDVVRSRQEVASKAGRDFTADEARGVCSQYLQSYQHIDNPAFGNNLIYFRYEDLLSEDVLTNLRNFTGCADMSTDNVWGKKPEEVAEPETKGEKGAKDPWFSPKYHSSIDLSSRLSPLSKKYRTIVNDMCEPFMKRFEYDVL